MKKLCFLIFLIISNLSSAMIIHEYDCKDERNYLEDIYLTTMHSGDDIEIAEFDTSEKSLQSLQKAIHSTYLNFNGSYNSNLLEPYKIKSTWIKNDILVLDIKYYKSRLRLFNFSTAKLVFAPIDNSNDLTLTINQKSIGSGFSATASANKVYNCALIKKSE